MPRPGWFNVQQSQRKRNSERRDTRERGQNTGRAPYYRVHTRRPLPLAESRRRHMSLGNNTPKVDGAVDPFVDLRANGNGRRRDDEKRACGKRNAFGGHIDAPVGGWGEIGARWRTSGRDAEHATGATGRQGSRGARARGAQSAIWLRLCYPIHPGLTVVVVGGKEGEAAVGATEEGERSTSHAVRRLCICLTPSPFSTEHSIERNGRQSAGQADSSAAGTGGGRGEAAGRWPRRAVIRLSCRLFLHEGRLGPRPLNGTRRRPPLCAAAAPAAAARARLSARGGRHCAVVRLALPLASPPCKVFHVFPHSAASLFLSSSSHAKGTGRDACGAGGTEWYSAAGGLVHG